MKAFLLTGLVSLLLTAQTAFSQIQWYQNQDGQNQLPYGTSAATVHRLTYNSFAARYLWQVTDDNCTWKISRTTLAGQELSSFFVAGINATAEIRTHENKAVYVLGKKYNEQQQLQVSVYKLNTSLQLVKQKVITLTENYQLTAINAFEIDESGNVYLAGDGQFDNNGIISYASFVTKLDKNLQIKWKKTDMVETSYARLHIESNGRVLVVEDHPALFPALRVKRYSSNGALQQIRVIQTDPSRYSLSSVMDKNGDWYIFGGKTVGDTAQAVYLQKMSKTNATVLYRKTYTTAPIAQLNDLKIDASGNLFTISTLYTFSEGDVCKLARINGKTGSYYWSRSFRFENDSCMFSKLVVDNNSRFYVIGEKRSQSYFSKGFALQMNKNGGEEARLISPDSVAMQRSHWLVGGIDDHEGRLIAVGNTIDFDTLTYSNTYHRAFAVRFNSNSGCGDVAKAEVAESMMEDKTEEPVTMEPQLSVYPNPVQQVLTVSNLNKEEYDRLSVFNMQGARMLQQQIRGDVARIDVGHLADGVYLLVLRSSITMKEKTIKFVVRK